jgi:glutamine synthetase
VNAQQLTGFVCCDLAGIVRGRWIPSDRVGERLAGGVGWVPANSSITPFDPLAEDNPHGPLGDVRLRPDPATHVRVDLGQEATALEFFLCDVVRTDGTAWDCCPRTFLRVALDDLRREAGVRLLASFEHEFQVVDDSPAEPAFSLTALRRVDPFGPVVMDALKQAGVDPELFLPEWGPHQFEVTLVPAAGLAAADRSIIAREVIREVARLTGRRVTFAPLRDADGVGNGVHIHFSFRDDQDRPVTYDQSRPGNLSELAGQFAAGVIRHAPALAAFAAPSAVSFLRLKPHTWSSAAACLGHRNREAMLRIAPVLELPGQSPAAQQNLEFRAADATACAYLTLGAIVRAGLEGVRHRLQCPPILDRDPSTLSTSELVQFGIPDMPSSLPEALACLDDDETARRWLPPLLYETYTGLKRAELEFLEGLDAGVVCRRYADVY